MTTLDTDPSAQVGRTVTLVGVARDAVAGAVVLLSDRTPVYVAGVDSWDSAWDRKRVRVTGVLRLRAIAPEPKVNEKGE
jgi:predicted oxidoreductase